MKIDIELLKHILQECEFILANTRDKSINDFEGDEILKRAIVRSINIIGEAVKKVSIETQTKAKEIEWRDLARTRDFLIHQYFGIDYEIVWSIVTDNILYLNRK